MNRRCVSLCELRWLLLLLCLTQPSCCQGSLFGFSCSRGNCTLGGLNQGLRNRRLILVNEGPFWLTILAESTGSKAAARFRSSEQKPVVVAPGGSASFVYVVLRDGVGRWQLTGRG